MSLTVSEKGLELIESFEGGQSADGLFHAYWDPYGHVWTIGYGETHGVHDGMTWTRAQATADLKAKVNAEYLPAVAALGVPLNPNQVDALASFVWNLGPGSMEWDVGRRLRAREYTAAANAMLEYTRAGGVVLAGLVRRRQAERALFLTPWVNPDPHGYLLFDATVRELHQLGKKRHGSEREIVKEYDRRMEHPKRYPRRLKVLRQDASALANRISVVQEHDPHGRDLYHRPWRKAQLEARAHGHKLV